MPSVVRPPRRRRTGGLTVAGALVLVGTATVLAVAGTSQNAAHAATAPVTPTVTATATATAKAAQLSTATATATTTTGPVARPGAIADANGVPIGAKRPVELAAAQMPGAVSEGWKPDGPAMVRATAGHDIGFGECASAEGSTSWIQHGYTAADGQDTADQDTFTYTDTAEAEAAFTAAADEMQACQPISRALQSADQAMPGALVSQTGVGSGAYAWTRTWDGVDGLAAAGGRTARYFVVMHANTLVVVTVIEYAGSTSAPIDAGTNPRILTGLVIALDGQRTETAE